MLFFFFFFFFSSLKKCLFPGDCFIGRSGVELCFLGEADRLDQLERGNGQWSGPPVSILD